MPGLGLPYRARSSTDSGGGFGCNGVGSAPNARIPDAAKLILLNIAALPFGANAKPFKNLA